MELKQIGSYETEYGEVIIFESFDNKENIFEYWFTLKGYGRIDYIFGVKDRFTAESVFDYISDGLILDVYETYFE